MDYEIHGILDGTFWWPVGEPWEKDLSYRFRRPENTNRRTMFTAVDEHETLRDALDRATNDGDSSGACRIRDGMLKVTRVGKRGYRVRFFPLSMFPTAQDYLS